VLQQTTLQQSYKGPCAAAPQRPSTETYPSRRSKKGGGGKNYSGSSYGGSGGGGQFRSPVAPSGPPTGPWICVSPWAQQGAAGGQNWSGQGWFGQGGCGQGLLGSIPQAHTAFAPLQVLPPGQSVDAAGLIAALQQMSMQGNSPWVVDTGASSHMSSTDGILLQCLPSSNSSIIVGNGTSIPVTARGHSILSTNASNFALNNILVVPSIILNLLSVQQFTCNNSCSIEFDACGFLLRTSGRGV
jgi:hypothetical protein